MVVVLLLVVPEQSTSIFLNSILNNNSSIPNKNRWNEVGDKPQKVIDRLMSYIIYLLLA